MYCNHLFRLPQSHSTTFVAIFDLLASNLDQPAPLPLMKPV